MEWLPGLSLVIHISFLASPIQTSEGSLTPLRTEVITKHRIYRRKAENVLLKISGRWNAKGKDTGIEHVDIRQADMSPSLSTTQLTVFRKRL